MHQLTERMDVAASAAKRPLSDIRLLAVSKKQPVDRIRALAADGQTSFGENYVDEAVAKMDELADLELEWHFIGPVQSNKTRALAERFDWIQSVDRGKIVRRLNEQRPSDRAALNVLIQVNLDGEQQKAGCAPEEIEDLAEAIAAAERLKLRGLMAIPAPRDEPQAQSEVFQRLRGYFDALAAVYPSVDTLSAGMSADLEAAIAAGSTMIRVGTDLFGPRPE
ncbi:MAG: YggS family pyridoxal phosphate-dependent enzyme [Wenzhouxiangella sp.]|nr:YggS family pyridoxal phosphate-dependent enzyme [Wenzhouxiangella sp.]